MGFAKYLWKKLPEMCEDKRHLALNIAELLPNMCDNHHPIISMARFREYPATKSRSSICCVSGGSPSQIWFSITSRIAAFR